MRPGTRPRAGFGLLELMLTVALVSLLAGAAVQAVLGAAASARTQRNLAGMQHDARFALAVLRGEILQAGYRPEPWREATALPAIAPGSADEVHAGGDRITLQRWSDRNCAGTPNPVQSADGRPAFHLLEASFEVTTSGNLAHTCRYGPGPAGLLTQFDRLGLVEHARNLQVLYAEDSDGDGNADRWVPAGAWSAEGRIRGVKLGLLLTSAERLHVDGARALPVFDETITLPADGRLRRVFTTSLPINGRLQR